MLSRIPSPSIPPANNLEDLRLGVQSELDRIVSAINNAEFVSTIDAKNNRISNVAWPVNWHDAVNVEFLKRSLEARRRPITRQGGGPFYDKATFGLGIDSRISVRNNTNPPYICMYKHMRLVVVKAIAKNPPTGQDAIIRINKNGDSILASGFYLPDGDSSIQQWKGEDLDISGFEEDDIITVDVIRTGSLHPGSNIVFVLKFLVD